MSTNDNRITHATYIQTNAIHDAIGRLHYICSPDQQEHAPVIYSTMPEDEVMTYWMQAAKDAQRAWLRHGGPARNTRCREAQEIIITLPCCAHVRSYIWLVTTIAQLFVATCGQDCTAALHTSTNEKNIHIHILFSLRRCTKVRDHVMHTTYKDAAGNIVDRTDVYDADGHLLPGCTVWHDSTPINGYAFGACDPVLGDYVRYQDFAYHLTSWINAVLQPAERYVVRGKWSPYIPQQHIGKRVGALLAERIRQCNALAQAINRLIDAGIIRWDEAQDIKSEVLTAATRAEVMQRVLLGMLLDNRITADHVAGTVLESIPADKYADAYHAMVAANNPKPMPEDTDPDKRELRRLYMERAKAYDDAYQNPTAAGRNYLLADAAVYTTRINRLRRKMGIYCSADHARAMRELDDDTRYWRSQVLSLQAEHQQVVSYSDQLWERYHHYESRIPVIAITPHQRARKAKFERKMAALAPQLLDAKIEERWAYDAYLRAAKAAKDTHDAYKAEQREYASYAVRSVVRNITHAVIPHKEMRAHETPVSRTPQPIETAQAAYGRKPSLDSIIATASRRSSHATSSTPHHRRGIDTRLR